MSSSRALGSQQPRRILIGALFVLLASWAALPLLQADLHGAQGFHLHARAAQGFDLGAAVHAVT